MTRSTAVTVRCPGARMAPGQQQVRVLKDPLGEHRSEGANHDDQGTGQDQHRSSSLGEQAPPSAYPTLRFNLNQPL